jgi:hypothetical protein
VKGVFGGGVEAWDHDWDRWKGTVKEVFGEGLECRSDDWETMVR